MKLNILNIDKNTNIKYNLNQLGDVFESSKIPLFIRGSLAYNNNNPFDLDFIVFNNNYDKIYNVINIFYKNKYKIDLLLLEYSELDEYFKFVIKHKSVPLNDSAKNIFNKIKTFNFNEIPVKNLHRINSYLQNPNLTKKSNYIYISKLIIRSLYEKYIKYINLWLLDLKDIYYELKNIHILTNDEKYLLETANFILANKNHNYKISFKNLTINPIINYNILTFDCNFNCDKIIDFFEKSPNKDYHYFRNPENIKIKNKNITKLIINYDQFKNHFPDFEKELIQKFNNYINFNKFTPDYFNINTVIIKKYINNATMKLHVDNNTLSSSKRFLTFIIYLKTCNSGETEFPDQNIKITPKKNTILFFPPYFNFPHQVNIVREDRYILSGFFELNF